mmetsp:Transcript_22129/g.41243  ORF Transcript_22129/g.41243 Transcript_22129/m.41243 type:complete len:343 (+) Transcript_22129:1923-2951(+)
MDSEYLRRGVLRRGRSPQGLDVRRRGPGRESRDHGGHRRRSERHGKSRVRLQRPLAGGNCVYDVSSCLTYCDNACLQAYAVETDSAFESLVARVSDETSTFDIPMRPVGDHTYTLNRGKLEFALPAGSFEVTFIDQGGNEFYPNFVNIREEDPPLCVKDATVLTTPVPAAGSPRCDELVRNGDFEGGIIDGWKQFFTGIEVAAPGRMNSAYSLKTTSRSLWNAMITKYLDQSCLVAGDTYDIELYYRFVDTNGNGLDCTSVGCPRLRFAYYPDGRQTWYGNYGTEGTYDINGWNRIAGQITITAAMAGADDMHLAVFDSTQTFSGGQYIIDDISITKVSIVE